MRQKGVERGGGEDEPSRSCQARVVPARGGRVCRAWSATYRGAALDRQHQGAEC